MVLLPVLLRFSLSNCDYREDYRSYHCYWKPNYCCDYYEDSFHCCPDCGSPLYSRGYIQRKGRTGPLLLPTRATFLSTCRWWIRDYRFDQLGQFLLTILLSNLIFPYGDYWTANASDQIIPAPKKQIINQSIVLINQSHPINPPNQPTVSIRVFYFQYAQASRVYRYLLMSLTAAFKIFC